MARELESGAQPDHRRQGRHAVKTTLTAARIYRVPHQLSDTICLYRSDSVAKQNVFLCTTLLGRNAQAHTLAHNVSYEGGTSEISRIPSLHLPTYPFQLSVYSQLLT